MCTKRSRAHAFWRFRQGVHELQLQRGISIALLSDMMISVWIGCSVRSAGGRFTFPGPTSRTAIIVALWPPLPIHNPNWN